MIKKLLTGLICGILTLNLSMGFTVQATQTKKIATKKQVVQPKVAAQTKTFKLMLNGKIKENVKITSTDGHWYVPKSIQNKYSGYTLVIQLSNQTIVATWKTYDIRNVNFGYTIAQVKQAEKGNKIDSSENNFLSYKVTMGNYDVILMYQFNSQGKLYSVAYKIDKDYLSSGNECIDDYEDIKSAMIKKYGNSQTGDNDYIWEDDLFKDDSSEWGTAIFSKDLYCISKWHMWNKDVNLFLSHDDSDGISLYIFYDSTIVAGNKDNTEQNMQSNI
jgi:hypothetical protein